MARREQENVHLRYLMDSFEEVRPVDFYRDLFPSGELDREGEFTPGKYTAIAVRVFDAQGGGKPKVYRYSVCDELRALDELLGCDEFCVMAPVSYAGKSQRQANARNLYAVVFDLDGLLETDDGRSESLINLFGHNRLGLIPKPSHIAFSGSGLHLYYMLERPVPLFPNVLKSLAAYRSYMVPRLWNRYVSGLCDSPQYESATQGFRMVGTVTKGGGTVRAFKTGPKVSIEYLNGYADEKSQIELVYTSETNKAAAKERWPEWYQRRIVEGKPRGTWTVKRDLYDWWIRKIADGATVGHRYFCVMALAVYARKCGISYEELEKDALMLVPYLNGLSTTDQAPFTAEDAMKALEAYDASYITFPRHTIEELTAIEMPPNKRRKKPLKRDDGTAFKAARAVQDIGDPDGTWRNKNGRPKGSGTKEYEIQNYAYEHPEASHSEVARALGVSRPTVIKWLRPGWEERYLDQKQIEEESKRWDEYLLYRGITMDELLREMDEASMGESGDMYLI